jgi:adenine-specific DNA-methyltransferase
MKYMGSKRWMLANGLGELLERVVPQSGRFVDLMCGSGAVSSFVATRHKVAVLAADLQHFSVCLAAATIERTSTIDVSDVWRTWHLEATKSVESVKSIPSGQVVTRAFVTGARRWCLSRRNKPIVRAYGGHYFSPLQAIWFDALLDTLPKEAATRKVALAAVIHAASQCAASPGHTAQPFQPTPSAKPFLQEAWNKNVANYVAAALLEIGKQHAVVKGKVAVQNALLGAKRVGAGDLVFVDPPYSAVQYSRFYHVLETISGAPCGPVSGVGRYPARDNRPTSAFSLKTSAAAAMETLLSTLADRKASVVLTFPNHMCSIGISGDGIRHIAARHFHITQKKVSSRLSTLGGPSAATVRGGTRRARLNVSELILLLQPRRTKT